MKLFNVRLGVLLLVMFSFVLPGMEAWAETIPSPGYLEFDGTRYVKIPKSNAFTISSGKSMTITMKVKQNYSQGNGNSQSLVSTLVSNNKGRAGFDIYNFSVESNFRTRYNFKDIESINSYLFNGSSVNFKNEHDDYIHIAVVFNASGANSSKSYIYLYSDGDLQEPGTEMSRPVPEIPILEDLIIGARYKSLTEFERFFYGQIDDLRFYGKALSQEEVRQDMEAENFLTGKNLIAAYDFNDLSDGIVHDILNGAHDGKLMGNWPTYGPPSQEAEQSYTVNIEQNEHADISLSVGEQSLVSGTKVEKGTTVGVAATPHEGYGVESIKVNGVVIEGNTFEVESDCTVSVTVKEKAADKFKVEYSAEGPGTLTVKNGDFSIVSGDEVEKDATLSCVVTPTDGYSLKSLTVNGIETQPDADGKFTVEVTENIEIKAIFEKTEPIVTKYVVTIEPVDHIRVILKDKSGEVIASGTEVPVGTEIKVETVIVDTYELTGIYVNEKPIVGFSFIVTENSVVKAEVKLKGAEPAKHIVTILGITKGSIKVYDEAGNIVAHNTSVPAGTRLRVDVTADAGYELDCIKVNGEAIEGNTFIVEGDCTISVVIKEKTATEKFKVEYTTEGEGTLSVKSGDADVASGDEVEKGTTLACQISAADGYRLKILTVNDVETQPDADGKFTVEVTGAVVIEAVFEKVPSEFTVTVEPVENVSVTLLAENIGEIESGATVAEGTIVTVTATPADGYEIEVISVNDMTIHGSTFTVRGQCRVRVEVRQKETPPAMYAVAVRTQPNVIVTLTDTDGNEITSGTLLPEGTAVKVSTIVAEGYELKGIYLNGEPMVGDTFTVSELSEIYAVVKAVEPTHFTVNISASVGGSVTMTVDGADVQSGEKVESGKTLVITCNAADGYMLDGIAVNSSNVPLPAEDRIETTVDSDMEIEVAFRVPKNVYFSVRVLPADHVTVRITDYKAPPLVDRGALQEGSIVTVTPIPDEGYEVEGIFVNDQQLHGDSFTVRRDSKIEVKVRKIEGETPEVAKYAVKVAERENVAVRLTDDSGNEIASGTLLPVGTLVTVTATPAEGYELESIYVNNVKLTGVNFTLTVESTVEAKVTPRSPAIVKYPVTVVEQENVTVTLKGDDDVSIESGTSLPEGAVVTVTATPAAGYELEGIYLNNKKLDGNTFTVSGESEIKAIVKQIPAVKEKYVVKVLAQSNVSVRLFDESATIIPSGTQVLEGTTVTVEVRPDEGYELEGLYLNDVKLDGNTFTVSGESVVKAIVREVVADVPETFKVEYSVEGLGALTVMKGGSFVASGSEVDEGETLSCTLKAADGWKFKTLTINGVEAEVSADGRFSVEVHGHITIKVTFVAENPEVARYVVTVEPSRNGTVTLSDEAGTGIESGSSVPQGTLVLITAVADHGYKLAAVMVNREVISTDRFTVTGDTEVGAIFEADPEIGGDEPSVPETVVVSYSSTGPGTVRVLSRDGNVIASGSEVEKGSEMVLVCESRVGARLAALKVSGAEVPADFDGRAEIVAGSDVEIKAEFAMINYTLTVTESGRGHSAVYQAVEVSGMPAGEPMAGGAVIHYGDVLHLFAASDKGYALISASVSNNGVATELSLDEDFTLCADGSLYRAITVEGDVMIDLRFSTVSSGADSPRNDGSKPRYYNLHGIEIPADRLSPGVYIMIDGAVKKKILIR